MQYDYMSLSSWLQVLSFAEMTELLKRKEEGRICVWVSVGVLVEGDGEFWDKKKVQFKSSPAKERNEKKS